MLISRRFNAHRFHQISGGIPIHRLQKFRIVSFSFYHWQYTDSICRDSRDFQANENKARVWILRMKFVTCCCAAAVEMIFGIMMLRKKRWSAKTDSEYFYFRPQQLSVPFECLLPKMNWTTTNSIWALFSCCCCGMLLSSFALPSSLPLTWFSLSYSVVALLFTRPLHTHCI